MIWPDTDADILSPGCCNQGVSAQNASQAALFRGIWRESGLTSSCLHAVLGGGVCPRLEKCPGIVNPRRDSEGGVACLPTPSPPATFIDLFEYFYPQTYTGN